MADIQVYISSTSGNVEIKKQQQRIETVLSGKKIKFETVDISMVEGSKEKMRELAGDPNCIPPQICKGDVYIGNYDMFDNAVEEEELKKFLQL